MNQIKQLRWERNMSLGDLAKLSGVSKAQIGKLENFLANPSQTTILKISRGFSLDANKVFNLDYRKFKF